jgi:hypothetical protein
MLHKSRIQQIVHGVQTGVETFGAIKGLYAAGQAAFSLGARVGAAAVPFIL